MQENGTEPKNTTRKTADHKSAMKSSPVPAKALRAPPPPCNAERLMHYKAAAKWWIETGSPHLKECWKEIDEYMGAEIWDPWNTDEYMEAEISNPWIAVWAAVDHVVRYPSYLSAIGMNHFDIGACPEVIRIACNKIINAVGIAEKILTHQAKLIDLATFLDLTNGMNTLLDIYKPVEGRIGAAMDLSFPEQAWRLDLDVELYHKLTPPQHEKLSRLKDALNKICYTHTEPDCEPPVQLDAESSLESGTDLEAEWEQNTGPSLESGTGLEAGREQNIESSLWGFGLDAEPDAELDVRLAAELKSAPVERDTPDPSPEPDTRRKAEPKSTLVERDTAHPSPELEADFILRLNRYSTKLKAPPTYSEFYDLHVKQKLTIRRIVELRGWKERTLKHRKETIENLLSSEFGMTISLNLFRNAPRDRGKIRSVHITYVDPSTIEQTASDHMG